MTSGIRILVLVYDKIALCANNSLQNWILMLNTGLAESRVKRAKGVFEGGQIAACRGTFSWAEPISGKEYNFKLLMLSS